MVIILNKEIIKIIKTGISVCRIFILSIILLSCSNQIPDWLLDCNHAISPDGKAAIYSNVIDSNRISVSTWCITKIGNGGGGVFDIETEDKSEIKLSWISDSTAQIIYPKSASIIRKKESIYFAGRTIKLKYKIN